MPRKTYAGEFRPGNGWTGRNPNRYALTGERRPPRKGEWYLSGAIPMAYQARADMSAAYHIVRPFPYVVKP